MTSFGKYFSLFLIIVVFSFCKKIVKTTGVTQESHRGSFDLGSSSTVPAASGQENSRDLILNISKNLKTLSSLGTQMQQSEDQKKFYEIAGKLPEKAMTDFILSKEFQDVQALLPDLDPSACPNAELLHLVDTDSGNLNPLGAIDSGNLNQLGDSLSELKKCHR